MGEMLLKLFKLDRKNNTSTVIKVNNLSEGKINKDYIITDINSESEEVEKFLFSLGCYKDELITLVSILGDNYIIKIKDGRYSIDKELASAIGVQAA